LIVIVFAFSVLILFVLRVGVHMRVSVHAGDDFSWACWIDTVDLYNNFWVVLFSVCIQGPFACQIA
jgi:hypothetical protein